jgi:hypothetical protein
LSWLAPDADGTAECLDEPPREREAEPRADMLAACFELLELHEQLAELGGIDADAVVLDLDPERVIGLGSRSHDHAPALGRDGWSTKMFSTK